MRFVFLLPCLLSICACSTPRGTENRRQITLDAIKQDDFATAAKTVDEIYGGDAQEEPGQKHLLLWYMQRGALQDMQHDFINSELFLGRASNLVDDRRGISVGGAVGASVANETVRAYAGEAFEHTQIELIRTLNESTQAEILSGSYQPPYTVRKDVDGSMQGPAVVDARMSAGLHMERARNIARKMTLDVAKETADAAGSRRYDEDPFASALAGALVLSMDNPSDNDRQLADAMLFRASEAYLKDTKKYAKDAYFKYEVKGTPAFVETLRARNGLRYNPEKFKDQQAQDWKKGYGSLFIVQRQGLISRPQTLDIRFVSGVSAAPKDSQKFTIGGLSFYATGPDTDIAQSWGGLVLPGEAVRSLVGSGLAVMGFAMPVHEKDQAVGAAAWVHVNRIDAPETDAVSHVEVADSEALVQAEAPVQTEAPPVKTGAVEQAKASSTEPVEVASNGQIATNQDVPLEVASDVDAYARATLKDEQVALFIKTFTRSVGKQIAAYAIAEEAKKKDAVTGFFTRLVGSTVATLSEVADTRSWWLLPDHISVALIDMPVGTYHVELEQAGGMLDLGTVKVREGRLVIVPVRTFVKNTTLAAAAQP